jgi:hypothetical protein
MGFHEVPWNSMRFYDVLVNQSVPTEANRGLTSYTWLAAAIRTFRGKVQIGSLGCDSSTSTSCKALPEAVLVRFWRLRVLSVMRFELRSGIFGV